MKKLLFYFSVFLGFFSISVFTLPAQAGEFGEMSNDQRAPYTNNLLNNPNAEAGDMSGWTITEDGGDGWLPKNVEDSRSNGFLTSYEWAKREQVVDLVGLGFSPAILDTAPPILISEAFEKQYSAGKYFLEVELLDANRQILHTWSSGVRTHENTTSEWRHYQELLEQRISNYGSGVRYIRWRDGGKSTKYLKGHYGPKLQNAYLAILPPNLLNNPKELSSWNVIKDGGDGFLVSELPEDPTFLTSYDWNIRQQTIDLLAHGYSADMLDQSPGVIFSGVYGKTYCPDKYYLKIELLDVNENVVQSWDSKQRTNDGICDYTQEAEFLSGNLLNYDSGVRYIRWEDGGKSSEYKRGHYGATLQQPYVGLLVVPEHELPQHRNRRVSGTYWRDFALGAIGSTVLSGAFCALTAGAGCVIEGAAYATATVLGGAAISGGAAGGYISLITTGINNTDNVYEVIHNYDVPILDVWGEGRIVTQGMVTGFDESYVYNLNKFDQLVSNGINKGQPIPNLQKVEEYDNPIFPLDDNSITFMTLMGAPITIGTASEMFRTIDKCNGYVILYNPGPNELNNFKQIFVKDNDPWKDVTDRVTLGFPFNEISISPAIIFSSENPPYGHVVEYISDQSQSSCKEYKPNLDENCIRLFENPNYHGLSQDICFGPNQSELHVYGADIILDYQSIKLGSNIRDMTLYGPDKKTITSNLAQVPSPWGVANESFFIIHTKKVADNCVRYFTESDYKGDVDDFCLDHGKEKRFPDLRDSNDTYSSVKVGGNVYVTEFQHKSIKGWSRTRKADVSSFSSGDNEVSSLEVFPRQFGSKCARFWDQEDHQGQRWDFCLDENQASNYWRGYEDGKYEEWNDRFESLEVGSDITARLWFHYNRTGFNWRFEPNSKDTYFGKNSENKFSYIELKHEPLKDDCVRFYERADYQGDSKTYCLDGRDDNRVPSLGSFNDKFSSVKVGKNVYVTIFEHTDFKGWNWTHKANVSSFSSGDNEVSSLEVFPRQFGSKCARFWDQEDHQGQRWDFCLDEKQVFNYWTGYERGEEQEWNGRFESLEVGSGVTARLWFHSDRSGFNWRFGPNSKNTYFGKNSENKFSYIELEKKSSPAQVLIMSKGSKSQCMDLSRSDGQSVVGWDCNSQDNQRWEYTSSKQFRSLDNLDKCIHYMGEEKPVRAKTCDHGDINQKWYIDTDDNRIYSVSNSSQVMTFDKNLEHGSSVYTKGVSINLLQQFDNLINLTRAAVVADNGREEVEPTCVRLWTKENFQGQPFDHCLNDGSYFHVNFSGLVENNNIQSMEVGKNVKAVLWNGDTAGTFFRNNPNLGQFSNRAQALEIYPFKEVAPT
ncbi:beta/gamma crystallin domain-containing protein, partial [Vibrio thalassae]